MALVPKRPAIETPAIRLEISGPRLDASLARLVAGAEGHGGIERYVEALKLKSALFRDTLGGSPAPSSIEPEAFKGLCPFMPTVRRRIARWLERPAYDLLAEEIAAFLEGLSDTTGTDRRLAAFGAGLGEDSTQRWVRDLAAEIQHNLDPERYPLMNRWVWDADANTGVIREIWHMEGDDHRRLDVPDGYPTFLSLREELCGYLSRKGFFRDVPYFVDILCAQIYAEYICEQGSGYLRTDFSAEQDPLEFTRRLLGLDGVRAGSGRTRLKTLEGSAFLIDVRGNHDLPG